MTDTHIALLRAINVGGRTVPMAELRALCTDLAWLDVRTYIQSGNLVFRASGSRSELEDQLSDALAKRFGFAVPVIVRTAKEWSRYLQANPFPDSAEVRPNRVMIALSREVPAADAVAALRERATNGERIELTDEVLWIDYGDSVADSRISPGLLDRLVGSSVTTRNWRTALKLHELACG